MSKIYLFNADSDLALANNDANYMSPISARQLSRDLALLPIWYADSNSFVLATSYPNIDYLNNLKLLFDLPTNIMTYSELESVQNPELIPWGWNKSLRKELSLLGIADEFLLSDIQLEEYRSLAHRSSAVKILNSYPVDSKICGRSFLLETADEINNIKETSFLLKAPLSGSGKGLMWCNKGVDKPTINWINRILKQQGSVVIEPIYDKAQDLALEFYIHSNDRIEFIGYSLFDTTLSGAYMGNQMIEDEEIVNQLETKYALHGVFEKVESKLSELLLSHYGKLYKGPLGVDMMICTFDSAPYYRLHPCVEVNARMNMGIVAHSFYERHVTSYSKGTYKIDYYKNSRELMSKHKELEQTYPLQFTNNKIDSGYLSLVPVTSESHYHCWVLIE